MARISKARVARAFREGDAAATAVERGYALENLLVYLFSKIPGVRLIRRNVLTEDLSGEIDLVFWIDKSALDFLPNVLLFECKNWDGRVDSASVSFFITKAVNRHLPYAFLIAANGVTGEHYDLAVVLHQGVVEMGVSARYALASIATSMMSRRKILPSVNSLRQIRIA